MAAMGDQIRTSGEPPISSAVNGPVMACVGPGHGAIAAARVASSLADRLGSRLVLATVRQPAPRTAADRDCPSEAVVAGCTVLDVVARELGHDAERHVAIGEPAERLLALADRAAAKLIVVAAPEQSGRKTPGLGCVYLALAGAGRCPVVVVPSGVHAIAATGPIVCGVDGSEPSIVAARAAARVAGRLETRLVLVHASSSIVEDGGAAGCLAEFADREAAQLLVTGSRGRGRIASALLGSVASRLATTAMRPLMIVPPRAYASQQ